MNDNRFSFENQEKNISMYVPTSEIIKQLDAQLVEIRKEIEYEEKFRKMMADHLAKTQRKNMAKKIFAMLASPILEGFLYGILFSAIMYWILTSL